MNKARGMPDVSISQTTQDAIEVEAQSRVKKGNDEMFENPNVKLEIKPTTEIKPMDLNGVEEGQEGFIPQPKAPTAKKKRKMTQAQLDALARGRETSMKNRVNKAKEKKAVKAEASVTPTATLPKVVARQKAVKFEYHEPAPIQPQQPSHPQQYAQQPQQIYNQPQIDYDKIINGVANIYQQREQQKIDKRNHEEQVNTDVLKYEEAIRNDERVKLMKKFEEQEKEKLKAKALKTTTNVLTRQPANPNDNPYAYAFQMNSRNNFKRY